MMTASSTLKMALKRVKTLAEMIWRKVRDVAGGSSFPSPLDRRAWTSAPVRPGSAAVVLS